MVSEWQRREDERRKAEKQCRERDEKFLALVRNSDLQGIKDIYPDAISFVKYANGSIIPYRDSFLAVLCKEATPEFVSSIFETYFSGNTDEILTLKEKFLQGKTNSGDQLDYHWFSRYLSPQITAEVNGTFGVSDFKASTEENADKKKIYAIIKEQYASLQVFNNKKITRWNMGLTFDGEKPGREYKIMGKLNDGELGPVASLVEESMPAVILRQLPDLKAMTQEQREKFEDKDNFSEDKVVQLEFLSAPSNLLYQTYKKLHFPEDYLWACKSLTRLEEEYAQMMNDEKLRSQVKGFAMDGSRIIIEDRMRCGHRGNSFGGYMAFSNGNDIVINASSYGSSSKAKREKDNALVHELGHHTSREFGKDLEYLNWMKWAYMLINIGARSPLRDDIWTQISVYYSASSYVTEFIANLTQRSKEVAAKDEEGRPEDPLLSRIYDAIVLSGEIVAHPEKSKWMKAYMRECNMTGEDADLMQKMYDVYWNFAENVQTVYFKSKRTTEDLNLFTEGRKETVDKLKEILDGRNLGPLEMKIVRHLDSVFEAIEEGKKLDAEVEKIYQDNQKKPNSSLAHLNYLVSEGLPALKKVFDEQDPKVAIHREIYLNYLKKIARPYGFEEGDFGYRDFRSFDEFQRTVDEFSDIVLNNSSYKEKRASEFFHLSIIDYRKLYAEKQKEYTQAAKTGTVLSWLQEKKERAWKQDSTMEAKQDFVMSTAFAQKGLFDDSRIFSYSNTILDIRTKESRNFVDNLPLLASDQNPHGLSPEIFENMLLTWKFLECYYEDAVDYKYYENKSTFEIRELGYFVAIGQEYLKRTGAKELPEELRLSNITPESIAHPKPLYESMKKYVDMIESGKLPTLKVALLESKVEEVPSQKDPQDEISSKNSKKVTISPPSVEHT